MLSASYRAAGNTLLVFDQIVPGLLAPTVQGIDRRQPLPGKAILRTTDRRLAHVRVSRLVMTQVEFGHSSVK